MPAPYREEKANARLASLAEYAGPFCLVDDMLFYPYSGGTPCHKGGRESKYLVGPALFPEPDHWYDCICSFRLEGSLNIVRQAQYQVNC